MYGRCLYLEAYDSDSSPSGPRFGSGARGRSPFCPFPDVRWTFAEVPRAVGRDVRRGSAGPRPSKATPETTVALVLLE